MKKFILVSLTALSLAGTLYAGGKCSTKDADTEKTEKTEKGCCSCSAKK